MSMAGGERTGMVSTAADDSAAAATATCADAAALGTALDEVLERVVGATRLEERSRSVSSAWK